MPRDPRSDESRRRLDRRLDEAMRLAPGLRRPARPYRQWMHPGEVDAATDLTGPPGGPYRGRGPRGWRRSDDLVLDEVCQVLADDGRIDASEIEVEVKDGIVRLRGTVDSRETKRMAEDDVLWVRGVLDVDNELRVVWPGERAAR